MEKFKLPKFDSKCHIYQNVIFFKDKYLLLMITLSTVANGLVPAITSILTGRVFDILQSLAHLDTAKDVFSELTRRSMSIMSLSAACFPIMWISISTWMSLGEKQGIRIRENLINSYLEKPMAWYDQNSKLLGDFTQVNRCVEELRSSSAEASAITFQNFVAILALIGTSFYYSWSLTLIILCSTPVIIVLATIFSRMINKYTELENTETTEAAHLLTWSMNASQLVKLYCSQGFEIEKFEDSTLKCNTLFIKACLYVAANTSMLRFLTLCMFVQGFWFGATQIRKGKLHITDVITCFHSCLMLGSTLNNTLQQIVLLQKGDVAMRRIQQFIDENEDETVNSEEIDKLQNNLIGDDYSIRFQNVFFKYPSRPTESILNDISLVFPSGKTTYVIGKSGSGKSTLSNLLLKFYSLQKGNIYLNDTDIKEIDQNWIIENVTVVDQRCTLFNDSLRNNILLGSTEFDIFNNSHLDKKLEEACTFALLDRFISSLENGINTKIGTGGVTLSGGQQQRVALARAFMRDTPILILDESISALDVVHRKLLMEAIRIWREGKTTIVLTHELNEIKANDYLYVLKGGSITEQGLQIDLINDPNSTFSKFYDLQIQNEKQYVHLEDNDSESSLICDYYTKYGINDSLDTKTVIEHSSNSSTTSGNQSYEDSQVNQKRPINKRLNVNELNDIEKQIKEDKVNINPNEIMPLKEIIFRMLKTIRQKKLLFLGIFTSIIAGATNPIFSYTFSYLLNGIVPSAHNDTNYLLKWSFIVLGVAFVDGLSNFMKTFILGYCSEYWIMDIRNSAMETITNKKLHWFSKDENRTSEISALVLNDLRDLRSLVSEFLSAMTTFVIVSLFGLIWALVSGWKLSLVCISMFPLIILFSGIYGSILQKYETNYKTSVANLENCHYEIVTAMKTIRSLQLEDHFLSLQRKYKQELETIANKRSIATGGGIAIINTLTMCIQSILYYYGLKLVLEGEYTSKKMFQTFTLLLFTIMTCTSLIGQIPDVTRGQRAASWIYRILDENETTIENNSKNGRTTGVSNFKEEERVIMIQNLSFAYPSAKHMNVYNNLNLELKNCSSAAIVGESGSGKSTLISLLTKLYDVPEGSIYVDGTDINEWNTSRLRNQIAVVEQKPVLFDDTVRANLLYGNSNENITDIDLYDVLKLAGVNDVVDSLTSGIETRINSDLLSGGQAQRICIARALLRKAKILILDECTSALDAESTRIITDIVKNGLPGVLIISITHSEQMMRNCNEIIVFKDSTVVEHGKFKDIYKQGTELFRILATGC